MMAHQSFPRTVLETALALAGQHGEATTDALHHALVIKTRQQQKRLLNALSDLSKAGRLHRLRQGVYGPPQSVKPPELQEVMWRLLRMRRVVKTEDLVELAGCSANYAKEWLRMLAKRQVVRRVPAANNQPHSWRLINDTVEMPVNTAKAAKLARLREQRARRKSEALAAVNQAIATIEQARRELNEATRKINDMEEVESNE